MLLLVLLWHCRIERNFGVGPSHGRHSLNLIELCLHVLQLLVDTVPWLRWHWLLLLLVAMPPLLSRSIVVCWTTNQLLLLRLVSLSDIAHGIFAKGQAATTAAHATSWSTASTTTEELILHLLGHHLALVLLHHLLDECCVHLFLVHHVVVYWGLAEGGASG